MIYTPPMHNKDCPFCNLSDDSIVASNDLALAICDNFPVSPGHMLFLPRRHVSSWFDATEEEQTAIFGLVNQFQRSSEGPPKQDPSAYNIGINIGVAAGQTVMHLHVHLIPRYEGDVDDPRGGVRLVLADGAKYWK
jgi:diadenosine tetraphosphate (Ap4A) HIT family hydrolase